jgi:hypothetical protein
LLAVHPVLEGQWQTPLLEGHRRSRLRQQQAAQHVPRAASSAEVSLRCLSCLYQNSSRSAATSLACTSVGWGLARRDQGHISRLEVLETLVGVEFTAHKARHIKVAFQTARLGMIKTWLAMTSPSSRAGIAIALWFCQAMPDFASSRSTKVCA